jgi:DNA (cytosine-5)-methyltransferase 1
MRHGSLFSGIGGFDLAAEWMGWENMFHCEWNQFGQKVLKYYWPNATSYDDICKTDFTIWRGRIDILTGGFPCQPYSMAGKRKGTEDSRHLWPEMLRAIRECQPTWIVGENVPGLINWSKGLVFEQVCADLEGEGYEVQPVVLPASGVNAPHRRDRVWFVAFNASICASRENAQSGRSGYSGAESEKFFQQKEYISTGLGTVSTKIRSTQNTNGNGRDGNEWKEQSSIGQFGDIGAGDNERVRADNEQVDGDGKGQVFTNTKTIGMERSRPIREQITSTQTGQGLSGRNHTRTDWTDWPTVSPLRSGNDGFRSTLDGITFPKWRNESIKAAGNAIVPQVAYQIFKVIEQMNTPDGT